MTIMKEIFKYYHLENELFLKPYRIISTGPSTGLVHVLNDSTSLDGLKKLKKFSSLNDYFLKVYGSSSMTNSPRLLRAKKNFVASLAAYSLFTYFLQVKDRHNGNIMIDNEGHILHIDFGFILSIAPGGAFSLETAPFKLTEEMVAVMGGLQSPLFKDFVSAFIKGFIALQANSSYLMDCLDLLTVQGMSPFPCFLGKSSFSILEKLKARFKSELSVDDARKHCLDLIMNSYNHFGTKQYDYFQSLTNGIMI